MRNNLTLFLNLILLALVTGVFWFGYSQSLDLKQTYQELNEASGESGQIRAWQKLLGETTKERDLIHRSVVTTDSLPDFIDQLEQLATSTASDLDISSATPGDKSNPNLRIAFIVSGRYNAVLRFTNLIDTLPVQLQVNRAEFSRSGSDEEGKSLPTWQARFEIELLANNPNNEKK